MVTDQILTDPRLYGALVVALALALVGQQYLGWRRYAQLHALRRIVFPALHGYKGLFLVSEKGYRTDDAEYLGSVDASVRATWQYLIDPAGGDGSPHLLSSLKRRTLPNGDRQYSAAHVVWSHSDGTQTEAYLFHAPEGGTDIYAHGETGVLDPEGHLTDAQTDGDARGVVWDAFDDEPTVRRRAPASPRV